MIVIMESTLPYLLQEGKLENVLSKIEEQKETVNGIKYYILNT